MRNRPQQPLERLVCDLRSETLTIERALELVDHAKTALHCNLDTGDTQICATIKLADADLRYTGRGLFNLHRNLYEVPPGLLDRAAGEAGLGLHAARRIGFRSGEFSFQHALATIFEKLGDLQAAAAHYYAARDLQEEAADAVFLEAYIAPQQAGKEDATDRKTRATLEEGLREARARSDHALECICRRGMALLMCDTGNPRAATGHFGELAHCARKAGWTIPWILALGDGLLAALHAGDTALAHAAAGELADAVAEIPASIAAPDLLYRSASLCVRAEAYPAAVRCLQICAAQSASFAPARWGHKICNAGARLLDLCQPVEARAVLESVRSLKGAMKPTVALSIECNYAAASIALGCSREILPELEAALAAAPGDADAALLAFCHGNLAYAHRNTGRYSDAIEHFACARDLAAQSPSRASAGKWQAGLATVYIELGDFEQARHQAQLALEIIGSAPLGATDRAVALGTLGNASLGLSSRAVGCEAVTGLHEDALRYFQEAMAVAGGAGNRLQANEWRINIGHMFAFLSLRPEGAHQISDAIRVFEEAARVAQELGQTAVECAAGLSLAHHAADRAEGLRQARQALALAENAGLGSLSWHAHCVMADLLLESGEKAEARRHLHRAVREIEAIRGRTPSASLQFFPTHTEVVYLAMARLCLEQSDNRAAWEHLTLGKARVTTDRLARRAGSGIEAWLAERNAAVLVDYFVDGDAVYAFTWRSGESSPGVRRISFSSSDLMALTDSFSREVFGYSSGAGAGENRWMKIGSPLVEALDDVPEGFHVCIVPHRWMHHVPLHALLHRGQPVIERHPVSYMPNAALLTRAGSSPTRVLKGVVYGDPRENLPFARLESLLLAERTASDLLTGPAASREAFLERCAARPDEGLLYVAAHVCLDDTDIGRSRILLGGGSELTFSELSTLRLGARLACWNGCSSGTDQRQPGDEMLGLIEASLTAGARSILVTSWNLEDVSACFVTSLLFDALLGGADLARALQSAVNRLRALTAGEVRTRISGWLGLEAVKRDARLTAELICAMAAMAECDGDREDAMTLYERALASDGLAPLRERQVRRAVAALRTNGPRLRPLPFAHPFFWANHFAVGDCG